MPEIAFTSAVRQAELVRTKEVSPVELVETYLRRIEKLDAEINAFVTLTAEEALAAARKAEERVSSGGDLPPFHGVPTAIKDLTPTAGIRTTFSSKAFADHVPETDAAVVRRIKEAGFLVLGKTNAPEFGTVPVTESELNGACRNPWDPSVTSGGSSGGAAAAVAAGMLPVAQGSDGGGSIRIPASCCGLFGIKPARGRVSLAPHFGDVWAGFATDGPIARTVADAAALLDVMTGYETGDPYWAPAPERPFAEEVGRDPGTLRIAVTTESPTGLDPDPQVVEAVRDAGELLASLGHHVEEASPEWVDPESASHVIKLVQANPVYYGVRDPSQLEPLNAALLEAAQATSSADYVRSIIAIHQFSRKVVAFWDDHDVLVTPTLGLSPPPVGWLFEEDDPWDQLRRSALIVPFTPVFNATGQPAVSVPLHRNAAGVPIGVQIAGPPAGEAMLIRLSAQLEAARPWADAHPPLS
ncbi:MAG: amidase [Actinomycetota bacterium]